MDKVVTTHQNIKIGPDNMKSYARTLGNRV